MAYFLKKCTKNNKQYLSIVNSYYDGKRGHTVHETYKSYGTGESLKEKGIDDPVKYLEEEVVKLNYNVNKNKAITISNRAPYKFAGHFLIKAILDKLEIKPIIDVYKLITNYQFDLYDVLTALIFSRCIKPCSKYKSWYEVIPYLEKEYAFSYDQLLEGLMYYGENYEKIVEIFTKQIKDKYGIKLNTTYFDCTNFYFEIDREDNLRRKGPSKENRKDPIVGLGLLLDGNQIPIGLKVYPGNESEKPKIREIIKDIKKQNELNGKVIQVADKGLNCARNIYEALKDSNGYIFSKSVKMLPAIEKDWVLLDNAYKVYYDENKNPIYKMKECVDIFEYYFEDENNNKCTFKVKEKRVVTYNYALAKKQEMEIIRLENKAKELCTSLAKKDEYGDCAKYVTFKGKDGSKAKGEINQSKIDEDKKLCGYNLLVTSETMVSGKEIYNVYHNLWRIEESFRIMKTELDARPVFLQKEETIKGHFLICYLSVALIRILQIYELKDEDSIQSIFNFIRDFKLVEVSNKYVNMATKNPFIDKLVEQTKLPLTNAIITANQYKKIMSYKL